MCGEFNVVAGEQKNNQSNERTGEQDRRGREHWRTNKEEEGGRLAQAFRTPDFQIPGSRPASVVRSVGKGCHFANFCCKFL
jgi:hypothetical protein